ncbi:M12 family metallopeptidase [Rhizobium leguminosarum]|uniref:M12 family metallopeptidase n=1 Tax=Rhizobium leguminosarum TaxID=384 RepID=UPI0013F2688D|nr:M12 family metallopeptidase [Rhizobium leguminosarum]
MPNASRKMVAAWFALLLAGCTHSLEQISSGPANTEYASVEINGIAYKVPVAVTAEGNGIFEGDLIVANASELQQKGLFIRERSALWPRGIVRYRVSSQLPNKGRVTEAISDWESRTGIRFTPARSTDRSYLFFVPAKNPGDCSTSVGYKGGEHPLYLGARCKAGNVIHEIGHVLGVAHEHMRSDQSRYIRIISANIKKGAEDNFVPKPRKYSDVGPYCYGSIMHYPRNAFGNSGRDTIIPKQSGVTIGQRVALARCDVDLVERMYREEYSRR